MTGSATAFRNIEKCSIYEADALFKGREPALALNHHLLSSTARSQLDDAEPVGGQIKKQSESRLVLPLNYVALRVCVSGRGSYGVEVEFTRGDHLALSRSCF